MHFLLKQEIYTVCTLSLLFFNYHSQRTTHLIFFMNYSFNTNILIISLAFLFPLGTVADRPSSYPCIQPVFPCGLCCSRKGPVCAQHGILYFGSPWI